MRIFPPQQTEENGRVRVAARVETEAQIRDLPKEIWYLVPEKFRHFVSPGMEAFVCALVPLAMGIQEDLHVEGLLSPRLAYSLKQYQKILHGWLPFTYSPVQVLPSGYQEPDPIGLGVAASFSGGVDSFYTLRAHLPRQEAIREFQVTHAIFLNHFDLEPWMQDRYDNTVRIFDELLVKLGVTLIPVDYNARDFLAPGSARQNQRWRYHTHGTGIASVGHFLSNGLQRLYMASSGPFTWTGPLGTSKITDHLFSSPSLDVVHHGLTKFRIQKLQSMLDWDVLQTHLRVCWRGADGVQNCGECPKCVRTMAILDLENVLDDFETFPNTIRPAHLVQLNGAEINKVIWRLFKLALRRRRLEYILLVGIAFLTGYIKERIRNIIKRFVPDFAERS